VSLLGNEKPMSLTRHYDRQLRYFMSAGAQQVAKKLSTEQNTQAQAHTHTHTHTHAHTHTITSKFPGHSQCNKHTGKGRNFYDTKKTTEGKME
jgi:hypothetical protein